jgi:hypothetical protein
MSKQPGEKGGGKGKGGKRRVVINLPAGSPLETMSEDEIAKHVQDLVGKAGINKSHVGGPVEELLIQSSDGVALPYGPGDGWAARWSRKCSV